MNDRPLVRSEMHWWEWLLLAAALLIFAAQAGASSQVKSAIFDEQYHLAAGYSYLRTGDPRLATNHPVLIGVLAALPLLARSDIVLPLDHPSWQAGDRFLFSDVFLWESNPDSLGILLAARWPITLLGVLLVAAIFFAGRQMLGARAGWLALLLAVCDPNLLAHSRFVTTDLGLALFMFVALWFWWRWLSAGGAINLVVVGFAAGLTMCAKYSGALLWPILVVVALLQPQTFRIGRVEWRRRAFGLLAAGGLALLVIWALYKFDVGAVSFLPVWLPLPAPFYFQYFWNTFFRIIDLQGAQLQFFMGEASGAGWWHYFFVALALKTPLPTLLLAVGGVALIIVQRSWRRLAVLWVTPLFFLLLGMTEVLNIGYRHMLPALPFLILIGSTVAEWRWLASSPRRTAVAGALLGLWLLAGSLRIAPHYESFFNELAGRWQNWSNILVDSNLDWGQDLPALRTVMDDLGIETVNLAYFGKAVPEKYGVRYQPLMGYLRFMFGRELDAYNPFTPEPGWYAISATSLRLGALKPENADLYAYFRALEPDARAGYSINLYHVVDPADLQVVRPEVISAAVAQQTPDSLGIADGVRSQVKWTQSSESVIYPQGEGFDAPDSDNYRVVNADFGDVFTLLGATVEPGIAQAGQPVIVQLFWRKGPNAMPMPAPTRGEALSVFVHLVDGDPANKLAQVDGWQAALRGLEPGDVIVQRMVLEIAPETPGGEYDLLVGMYSPQDWARLTVDTPTGAVDHANVGFLSVQSSSSTF